MELTVGKADLQKELQLCQGVVEKRSTIPILSNVLLKASDGRLQIAATDLDVTILSSCAARVTTPGRRHHRSQAPLRRHSFDA